MGTHTAPIKAAEKIGLENGAGVKVRDCNEMTGIG
jgi:hypothetical protein